MQFLPDSMLYENEISLPDGLEMKLGSDLEAPEYEWVSLYELYVKINIALVSLQLNSSKELKLVVQMQVVLKFSAVDLLVL